MKRFLRSAGRNMYVPFVPLTFFVYDSDDKGSMFNKESFDPETICMNAKDDNRKSKDLVFESGNQNFHIDYRSFSCESPGLKNEYVSFNCEYQSLKSNYPGLNSESRSLKSNFSSLNNEYPSLKSEYPGLKSKFPGFTIEYLRFSSNYPSLISEYSGINNEYPSLKSEYPDLKSEYPGLKSNYLSFNSNYQGFESECQSLKSENGSLENESCKVAGENTFSGKLHNHMINIQVRNQSGPGVSNIYREEEDPDRFRMPTGGQHAGLRESIQHWKR